MWRIENRTPFAADRAWTRDRDGAEVWLVAVKATFDIREDGTTTVAREQPPVLHVAEHHGDASCSSIKYEADLVLTKTTTDILVVGHAYAASSQPSTHLDVGFSVGPMQKIVRVFGDRSWGHRGRSAARPFLKMPLLYERAFGGVDADSVRPETQREWRNPVGVGFCGSSRRPPDGALPNIEDPRALIESWNDRPAPAGFGAIASHWQPRAEWAGTYDDHWMKTRQPLLAEDLDDRFFQCAPVDQQMPAFLNGGESVTLVNMTPNGRLTFRLPRLFLGFETRFFGGDREIHRKRKLHTVIIEPDFPRVSLVWHSALACHFRVQKLDRTIVTQKTELASGSTAVDATAGTP